MKHLDTEIKAYQIRSAWQPPLMFLIFFLGLGLAMLIKGLIVQGEDLILEAPIFIVIGIGVAIWLGGFKLKIDNGNLIYYAPFFRPISIPLEDIRKISTGRIVVSKKIQSTGYQTVLVETKNQPIDNFTINARVFPEKQLLKFLDELERQNVTVVRT